MHQQKNSTHKITISCALLCTLLLTAPAWADTSYSFPRVLEGSATLLTADGDREELIEQQPILVGDRIWVPTGTRLELILADRSQLRIEGDSEVEFNSIAYSADTEDRATTLRLRRGHFQLVVPEDALGESLARLDTPDSTIYVHREGTFRITVDERTTELVVREGLAELVTDRSSRLLHPDEVGWAEAHQDRLEVRRAHRRDDLERWGDRLSDEARLAYSPHLDDSLRYYSASLANDGTWFEFGGRQAWRPRVEVSWRPYSRGYWRSTPAGQTWVSYDSWGYVTHHYGDWDYDDHHGWIWYPGRVYSPARVHWYWGPTYVGWCPSGYYSNYYGGHHSGFGLQVGIYGWAGGSWDPFSHWSFSLNLNFGHRYGRDDHHRTIHSGSYLARNGHHLDRGIISNDHRVQGNRADEIYAGLRHEVENRHDRGEQVHDVTDFVARRPLREHLAETVLHTSQPTNPLAGVNPSNTPTHAGAGHAKPARPTIPEIRGEAATTHHRPTRTEVRGQHADSKPLTSVEMPVPLARPGGRYEESHGTPSARPADRVPTARPTERAPRARPNDHSREPTARPAHREPTTRPAHREPTARPAHREPTARPAHREPTARPAHREPTARPAHREKPKADHGDRQRSNSNKSAARSGNSNKKREAKARSDHSGSRHPKAKKKKERRDDHR